MTYVVLKAPINSNQPTLFVEYVTTFCHKIVVYLCVDKS